MPSPHPVRDSCINLFAPRNAQCGFARPVDACRAFPARVSNFLSSLLAAKRKLTMEGEGIFLHQLASNFDRETGTVTFKSGCAYRECGSNGLRAVPR